MDLLAARAAMIDSQVRTSDVTDRRLIAAMAAIPRDVFVPAGQAALAYAEIAIETGPGRSLMTARDFSRLADACAITETDRVLDVASGSGYSAAVFSHLATSVVALEQDEAAAKSLRDALARAAVSSVAISSIPVCSVEVISGSLKAGAPAKAPFDVIFVNGAVEVVSQAWLDQLADGGRLAVVVDEGRIRRARLYTRSGDKTAWRTPFEAAVPILPGFERAEEFRL